MELSMGWHLSVSSLEGRCHGEFAEFCTKIMNPYMGISDDVDGATIAIDEMTILEIKSTI